MRGVEEREKERERERERERADKAQIPYMPECWWEAGRQADCIHSTQLMRELRGKRLPDLSLLRPPINIRIPRPVCRMHLEVCRRYSLVVEAGWRMGVRESFMANTSNSTRFLHFFFSSLAYTAQEFSFVFHFPHPASP